MIVYMIETRHKDYTEFVITASHERTERELATAEERDVGVIVTPYKVEDLKEKKNMKLAENLNAFKKVSNREEWEKWLQNYRDTHDSNISSNFFMDRYSYYDFNRCNEEHASIRQLIAFEEYEEYYILKEEYC